MEGFFSQQQVATAATVRRIKGCGACGLKNGCNSPKMAAIGTGENGIMLLMDKPNAQEDKSGGVDGGDRMLRRVLQQYGVALNECRKVYAVRCRPEGDEAPTKEQVDFCRPDVWREIDEYKPKVIMAFGIGAIESIVGHRMRDGIGSILRWRGWAIPDRECGCWVIPVMQSSDVAVGMEKNRAVETIWKVDIALAIAHLKKRFPQYSNEADCVEILEKEKHIVDLILDVSSKEFNKIAFDYETTGLKPYTEGHRIVSCAMAQAVTGRGDKAWAWLWPKDPASPICAAWKKLMLNAGVYKIAQNMKFEDLWTNIILGHGVASWEHDTMLVTHILDNRPDITGLKFQAYVQFGLLDYNSEVEQYIKSSDEDEKLCGANAFNRMHLCPTKPLLIYNGIDALAEWRLYEKQIALIPGVPF